MAKIALVFLLVFFFAPPVLADTPVIVRITPAGFVPRELTVDQGKIVIFQNESDTPSWPASNIHPTHRLYPHFDSKKGIGKDQTWSFRFDKAGQWGFHDHLKPSFFGKVIVKGDQAKGESKQNMLFWEKLSLFLAKIKYLLLPQKLAADLKTVDFQKVALDAQRSAFWLSVLGMDRSLDELIVDSGGGTIVDCHQEAHLLGRTAYEFYQSAVFQKSRPECHSGFIHGAMEAFLVEKGMADLPANIDRLCSHLPTSFSRFECFHGVGHGVLAFQNYDLPQALKICQSLRDDFQKSSCYGGIFMENIVVAEGNGARPAHETKWVSSDPHFPCNAIDVDFEIRSQCYYMQTSRMLNLFGHDYPQIVSECLNAPQDMVGVCFQSLGRDVAGQSLRAAEKISEVCQLVPRDYFDRCLTGGLNVIIDFWGERLTDQAAKLCQLVANQNSKQHCYLVYAKRLKGVYETNKKDLEKHCQFVEIGYQSSCRKTAGI